MVMDEMWSTDKLDLRKQMDDDQWNNEYAIGRGA